MRRNAENTGRNSSGGALGERRLALAGGDRERRVAQRADRTRELRAAMPLSQSAASAPSGGREQHEHAEVAPLAVERQLVGARRCRRHDPGFSGADRRRTEVAPLPLDPATGPPRGNVKRRPEPLLSMDFDLLVGLGLRLFTSSSRVPT